MDRLRAFRGRIEILAARHFQPLRLHLSAIGGFLVLAGLIAHGTTVITQWGHNVWYMDRHRGLPRDLAKILLLADVTALLGGSCMLIFGSRNTEYAIALLIAACLFHGWMYNITKQSEYCLSTLTYAEGLLVVWIDAAVKRGRLSPAERTSLLMAARGLLIPISLGFLFHNGWSIPRFVPSVICLAACMRVASGGPHRRWYAAAALVALGLTQLHIPPDVLPNRNPPPKPE
ncbi:hypothetical protein C8R43DRAFT_969379 [Mycena crocata]|nr:hypothetical protein C8R43DRAFT_969379 [Mycena crocata]